MDDLMTVREAAQRLGVHENTIRNWVRDGSLTTARLPGTRFHRFEAAEIERIALARGRATVDSLRQGRRVAELAGPGTVARAADELATGVGAELVGATELSVWAQRRGRDAQGVFPRLVRRLLVNTPAVLDLSVIRADEGVAVHGWDGLVRARRGSLWVPAGPSAWEFGV